MAKSLLAVKTKKKPVARQPKYTDTRFTGDEPVWIGAEKWSADKLRSEVHRGFYFYNYYSNPGDMRKYVVQYGQKHLKWTKEDISAFNECDDQRVGQTICSYAKMVLDGAPIPEEEYAQKKIDELLGYGKTKLSVKKEAAKPKRNVQDHMNDKLIDVLGDIEHWYDSVVFDEVPLDTDMVAYFREINMPQQFVSRIRNFYEPIRDEMVSAKDKKADPELREAYKNITAAKFKQIVAFYTKLFDALDTYGAVKSATRKIRKPRPVSKEKLVKKIKYCTEDTDLNLVSINPVDIIGAEQLWIYNRKTRKLGKYVAAADSKQLTIKGTAIIGYDEKQSIAKTIRKPENVIKKFMSAGKVALRTWLDEIKTTPVQLNGRLTADTLILKVQK